MKPILMHHSTPVNESFQVRQNCNPHLHSPWHYHPEYEITFIKKGKGILFIGDEMIKYKDNDIVIIGPNLPHKMRSASKTIPDLESESVSIYFSTTFLGQDFYQLPEALACKVVLQKALRGIKIGTCPEKKLLIKNIQLLMKADGMLKISKLLEIIHLISKCSQVIYLSSSSFINTAEHHTNHKINSVYQYVMKNFCKDIAIDEVAAIINMIPTSFCRFFKERTNKQFIKFLNEIRTGYACRLLLEKNHSITQVAYKSGFGTLSNFNKQFKKAKGTTPSLFVKHYFNPSAGEEP